MALTPDDLAKIEAIIVKHLDPIRKDVSSIKEDVKILAKLNQLDDIRKEPRLRALYTDEQEEA